MKKGYSETINDALKSIKDFSNGNCIMGNPIITGEGSTVIPVSKITVGLLSGKGEYGEVKIFKPNKNYPNTNAGGGIVSVKPFGFLVEKKGRIKFISTPIDYIDKAMDYLVNMVEDKNEKT